MSTKTKEWHMTKKHFENPATWLTNTIEEFVKQSPQNSLQNNANDKAFDEHLVGFSKGNDPLYEDYKQHVGPFHWTPMEIFNQAFRELSVSPEELTVISWILPQTASTKSDNQQQTKWPAERWARARIYGEEFNVKLRKHVVQTLQNDGYEAVAPMLSPMWSRKESEQYGFASTWSERHAAYASGLGTFGLCDGLITPLGKAMRTGSVVACIQIPPTPRPYSDHHAYCPFFTQGICGKCIARCPVGAITEDGHDKDRCSKHTSVAAKKYTKTHYGFDGKGCGLCQTMVPCESKIPTREDVEAYD
jgi:epoxyqueuosine reductase QueG